MNLATSIEPFLSQVCRLFCEDISPINRKRLILIMEGILQSLIDEMKINIICAYVSFVRDTILLNDCQFIFYRQKEVKMMEVIREVFLYMIFLYLLMMVSYGNRDPVSHRLYSSLYQEFHDAAYLPEDGVTLDSVCHLI